MAGAKEQPKPRVAKHLKEFFEAHPDEVVKIYRLMNASGFDEKQIRAALSNARKMGYPLEVVTRGQAWIYRSPVEDAGVTRPAYTTPDQMDDEAQESAISVTDDEKGFYMVSTSVAGNPILQRDCDGTFWIAHPV